MNNHLSRSLLTTIYKSFVIPYPADGDIIIDRTYKNSFQQRLESLQYKVSLAMTGSIKGYSMEKR